MVQADFDRAKRKALSVVNDFGITSPNEIDLESIAWGLGVDVRESHLSNCEAQLIRKGAVGILRIRPGEKWQPRGRFSIGHELGHWTLHEGKSQYWICSADQIHRYKGNAEEQEANAFSAELLMPTPIFAPMCQSRPFNKASLEQLSHTFETSLQATAIRMAETTQRPGMVVVSGDSEVKWTARSSALSQYQFYVPKGHFPDDNTLASFTEADGDQERTVVPADAWFPNLSNPDHYRVWEETKRLTSFGLVLSFLTIQEL